MPDFDVQSRMHRLDEVLQEAEQTADPATAARLQEVASILLEIHGAALQQILARVNREGDAGAKIMDSLASDPAVSPVLVLHDLHPLSARERVEQALAKVSPYVHSHGGNVELVSLTEDGVLTLRMEGSCHGCPSSRVTLQTTIESEIYSSAPEMSRIVVEGLADETPAPAAGFVPIERLAIHGEAIAPAAVS